MLLKFYLQTGFYQLHPKLAIDRSQQDTSVIVYISFTLFLSQFNIRQKSSQYPQYIRMMGTYQNNYNPCLNTLYAPNSTKSRIKYLVRQASEKKKRSHYTMTQQSDISPSKYLNSQTKDHFNSQSYENIKEKIKQKIKRIISERRLEADITITPKGRLNTHGNINLNFLKNTYLDYLQKQVKPQKFPQIPLVIEKNTTKIICQDSDSKSFHQRNTRSKFRCSQRYSHNEPFFNYKQALEIKKKPSTKIIKSQAKTEQKKNDKIEKGQKQDTKKEVMKMIRHLKKATKRDQKFSKVNSEKFLFQDLEPWSN